MYIDKNIGDRCGMSVTIITIVIFGSKKDNRND